MWKDYYKRFRKEARLEVRTHPYKQFQKVEDDAKVTEKVENEAESTRRDNTRRTHNDRKEFRRNYKFGGQYNEQNEKSGVASSRSNLDPAGKENEFDSTENGFDSTEQRQVYRREKTQKNGWKRKAAKFEQKSRLIPQDDEELRDAREDKSSFESHGERNEFSADEEQGTDCGERKTRKISWKNKSAPLE